MCIVLIELLGHPIGYVAEDNQQRSCSLLHYIGGIMEYLNHPYWVKFKANEEGDIIGPRGFVLNPSIHHTGYSVITVRGNGEMAQMRCHRLIWECHHGLIEDSSLVINHINCIKTDNRLENLELVTSSRNSFHAYEMGTRQKMIGESNGMCKLSNESARELILLLIEGRLSNDELAVMFGLHPRYISCVRGRSKWKWLWDIILNE